MKFIELKNKLSNFIVFSVNDILKVEPDFHNQRLSEWQKKGYIKKISKNYYFFSDLEISESVLFIIANKIYQPSYVSLEVALSYYGLIPEGVYTITSISSKITKRHETSLGHFTYSQVKPEFMFGYKLVCHQSHNFKIADPEKAILDYLYLNSRFNNENEFEELRFNKDVFNEKVDINKIKEYLALFSNKLLEKRLDILINFINNA